MSSVSSVPELAPRVRGKYVFPPGMPHNLAWTALRRMRLVDPIHHFQNLTRKYGDVSHYMLGPKHIVFLNQPEYIREVLIVQHANFIKERTQQRARLLLGQGMITAAGATHKRQRQVAQPMFHRQAIPGYSETIVRNAAEMREQWRPGTIDIYKEMMHLTLGIVGQTLFATDIRGEVAELNAAVGQIMDVYNAMVLLPGVKYLMHIPGIPLHKFQTARATLREFVTRLIDQHRAAHRDVPRDLLDLMLQAQTSAGWSDDELRDQLITVFLAAYETVAIALTWTWYLLSQNSEAEQKLHDELDTVLGARLPEYADLPNLRYAEMLFAESMRLYPPAWAMGREAVNDFELGPYRLPAGTTVLMSQFITHRDPRFFPDPLRFDPERHTPEAKANRPRFSYFPFGMGPRQCIGEAFAWMEGVLALATIAQKWKLRHVPEHKVEPQPLFTLRPKYGMQMLVEKRR